MANPFHDLSDGEQPILEGFLCPMCKIDLKTPENLTIHVEKDHSIGDQDLLKSFKDIFITAKKKIRYFDENLTNISQTDSVLKSAFTNSLPKIIASCEPQEVGAECNHLEYFKSIRAPGVERYATETNKLIIRLHKLLMDRPVESLQRKQQEQSLVPWLDGTTVKLCPNCAAKFNITRRQHHCRLCGSVICHNCSNFLAISQAISLINPTVLTPNTEPNPIKNDKSNDSLRTCDYCLHLLNNRKAMQDTQSHCPPILVYYEKIRDLKKNIVPDINMYNRMIKTLWDGDSVFTLADASALRGKIGHVAELIDQYSKAIIKLPTPTVATPSILDECLKKSIRLACIQYIKDEMISLDPLPLEKDIKDRQAIRKRETEQRIELERQLAQQTLEKTESIGMPTAITATPAGCTGIQIMGKSMKDSYASGSAITSIDNWTGHQTTDTRPLMNDDPLIEQINIIKGYIKQARIALRFEEVATLEMNLRELEQEFYNNRIQSNE